VKEKHSRKKKKRTTHESMLFSVPRGKSHELAAFNTSKLEYTLIKWSRSAEPGFVPRIANDGAL